MANRLMVQTGGQSHRVEIKMHHVFPTPSLDLQYHRTEKSFGRARVLVNGYSIGLAYAII